MPDQNTNAADARVDEDSVKAEVVADSPKINAVSEIINKITESKYILVALSGGPSIDELSAAIGLTSYLNKIGKRATAIYSGKVPEALNFLDAGNSFDHSADVMQDFVISLNKDKADHLRYKPEGEFVKIFITPYREKVTSDDLDYSYGDFNVDLVIALNVVSGIDLDDALREYGRIMQDATIVNIAASRPGKLGDIEWSNPQASSVSEMTAHLLHEMHGEIPVDKDEATAFFAGIVSATNRFSNASTTPFTLTVSSWLMECGANQQLVAENITSDVDNQLFTGTEVKEVKAAKADDSNMEIAHDEEAPAEEAPVEEVSAENEPTEAAEEPVTEESGTSEAEDALADLKELQDEINNEQDLTTVPAPEIPVEVAPAASVVEAAPTPEAASPIIDEDGTMNTSGAPIEVEHTEESAPEEENFVNTNAETVIAVPENFDPEAQNADDNSRFGKMLEDALSDGANPAVMSAPAVAAQPEVSSVPDINYADTASADILPPPPAPTGIPGMPEVPQMPPTQPMQPVQPMAEPVQAVAQPMPQPAQAAPEPAPESLIQSRPPVQLVPPQQPTAGTNPGIADPGAFRIPGM